MTRRWSVSHGYYCDVTAYEGPSTWLAGLHLARAARDHSQWCVQIWDLESMDGEYDEDGAARGSDSRTEEEAEFFESCESSGRKWSKAKLTRQFAKRGLKYAHTSGGQHFCSPIEPTPKAEVPVHKVIDLFQALKEALSGVTP